MTDKTTPIDPITHADERVNIPTPELAPMMDPAAAAPISALKCCWIPPGKPAFLQNT